MSRELVRLFHIAVMGTITALTLFQSFSTPVPTAHAGPFLGPPSYDSGFVAVARSTTQTVTHNLGGNADNYLALVDCKGDSGVYPGPLRWDEAGGSRGFFADGVTAGTARLFRAPDDGFCEGGVRIRIWASPPDPDYTSDFVALAPGASQPVTHSLGGNADNYLVLVDCKGANNLYPGPLFWQGITGNHVGFSAFALGDSSVWLDRGHNDTLCSAGVRVRIWASPPSPDFTSGLLTLATGDIRTVTHNLGGNADHYVAIVDARWGASATYPGLYPGPLRYMAFGDHVGFYADGVTSSIARLRRAPNDPFAEMIRIRIWSSTTAVSTPTVTTTATTTQTPTTTPTITPTATIPATPAATTTATVTPPSVAGQWLDRPPAAPNALSSCPSAGQWLLGYWGGASNTPITTAADACSSADLYWVSRGGTWRGFAKAAPAASDSWNVDLGEAHFIHGQ
jgi:hypothetical protein